jgi:hypothetical protein
MTIVDCFTENAEECVEPYVCGTEEEESLNKKNMRKHH